MPFPRPISWPRSTGCRFPTRFNRSLNRYSRSWRPHMASNLLLQDRIIFLTGGSTGIGRECAIAYAREGATVAIVDIDGSGAEKAATELGSGHLGVQCDVSSGPAVDAAVARTLTPYGRLYAIPN